MLAFPILCLAGGRVAVNVLKDYALLTIGKRVGCSVLLSEVFLAVFYCSPIVVVLAISAMAPHSSTLAWKIPWAEKPGGLQSMG